MRYAYLENTNGAHNKYYEMEENNDGKTWIARYGRIGISKNEKIYSLDDYIKKYDEKIAHGYVDKTSQKQSTRKATVKVNQEHLGKIHMVHDALLLYHTEVVKTTHKHALKFVSEIKNSLKAPKVNLSKKDMIYLNEVWETIQKIQKNTKK